MNTKLPATTSCKSKAIAAASSQEELDQIFHVSKAATSVASSFPAAHLIQKWIQNCPSIHKTGVLWYNCTVLLFFTNNGELAAMYFPARETLDKNGEDIIVGNFGCDTLNPTPAGIASKHLSSYCVGLMPADVSDVWLENTDEQLDVTKYLETLKVPHFQQMKPFRPVYLPITLVASSSEAFPLGLKGVELKNAMFAIDPVYGEWCEAMQCLHLIDDRAFLQSARGKAAGLGDVKFCSSVTTVPISANSKQFKGVVAAVDKDSIAAARNYLDAHGPPPQMVAAADASDRASTAALDSESTRTTSTTYSNPHETGVADGKSAIVTATSSSNKAKMRNKRHAFHLYTNASSKQLILKGMVDHTFANGCPLSMHIGDGTIERDQLQHLGGVYVAEDSVIPSDLVPFFNEDKLPTSYDLGEPVLKATLTRGGARNSDDKGDKAEAGIEVAAVQPHPNCKEPTPSIRNPSVLPIHQGGVVLLPRRSMRIGGGATKKDSIMKTPTGGSVPPLRRSDHQGKMANKTKTTGSTVTNIVPAKGDGTPFQTGRMLVERKGNGATTKPAGTEKASSSNHDNTTTKPAGIVPKDKSGKLCHGNDNLEMAKVALSILSVSVKNKALSLAEPSEGLLILLSKNTLRKKMTVFTKLVSQQAKSEGKEITCCDCMSLDMLDRFCNGALLSETGDLTIPLRVFINKVESKKRKASGLIICSKPVDEYYEIIEGISSLLMFCSFFDEKSSNKVFDTVFYHLLDLVKDDNVFNWLTARKRRYPNTYDELFTQLEVVYQAFISFVDSNVATTMAGQALSFDNAWLVTFYNHAAAFIKLLDEKPEEGTFAKNIQYFLHAIEEQRLATAPSYSSTYAAMARRISVVGNKVQQGFLTKVGKEVAPPELNSGKTLCLPYCCVGSMCKTIECCHHEHVPFHHMSPSDRIKVIDWVRKHKAQVEVTKSSNAAFLDQLFN